MLVGELMTRRVVVARPDTPIVDIAQMMRGNDIGAVLIAEDERLVGMLTDRDIVVRIVGNGGRASTATARDAMTPRIFYAFDNEESEAVAANMRDLQVRRMPVLNRGKRLVGIVSLGDLSCRIRPEIAGDALEGISESLFE